MFLVEAVICYPLVARSSVFVSLFFQVFLLNFIGWARLVKAEPCHD